MASDPLRRLHFVSLDNPWPPDYGGAIDLFHKLQAFAAAEIDVFLHFFHKPDRQSWPPALGNFCREINPYPRYSGIRHILHPLPYSVRTRHHPQLWQRLTADDAPIWFEGVHTTAWVPQLRQRTPQRPLFLRMHNQESLYYTELARREPRWSTRLYYHLESWKYQQYEAALFRHFTDIFSISQEEASWASQYNPRVHWLPAFVEPPAPGLPTHQPVRYILYHGNFRIQENRRAAEALLEQLLPRLRRDQQLWLAGKSVPAHWLELESPQLRVWDSPRDMTPILVGADTVVLPVRQKSGVKIKFIQSVLQGKRVLARPEAVRGSGLEADTPQFDSWESLATRLQELERGQLQGQMEALFERACRLYDVKQNTDQVVDRIWP